MWHYRAGAKRYRVDADTVGRELVRIHDVYGVLRRVHVVAESVDPEAPCHREFNWGSTHAERLECAGRLIRDVVFIEPPRSKGERPVSVRFVTVPEGRAENRYEPSNMIVHSQSDYFRQVLKVAKRLAEVEGTFEMLTRAAWKSGDTGVRQSAYEAKHLLQQLQGVRRGLAWQTLVQGTAGDMLTMEVRAGRRG